MLIYIVDDNLDMCEFLSFLLVNEGYRVHAFPCPVEALDHMKEKNLEPTVLITDYNMPKLNGFELHQQVSELAPEVKTIVISGRSVHNLIGKLNFLQKPFAPEHLLKLIKAVSDS
ncbi:response regulator [Mariprofundus ferrooxydans]|nr:response regulator [Mariprofundus ferrooxydans]